MSDKNLRTEKGRTVCWFEPTYDDFLDHATLLFGATKTGKTYLISEILQIISGHIPNYIVICPDESKHYYADKLPGKCIKEDLSKSKLEKIYRRQKDAKEIYTIANNIDILRRLFDRLADANTKMIVSAINKTTDARIKVINKSCEEGKISEPNRISLIKTVNKMCTEQIAERYRHVIRKHKSDTDLHKTLSKEELTALIYVDFNPRMCIIIDDKSEAFSMWMSYFKRNEENLFETIFYKGRHLFITIIIAAHDDKIIKPELRKNAKVVYYTTSNAAVSSVMKPAAGFSSQERREVQDVVNTIFDTSDGIETFRKFCYMRSERNPYKYRIANDVNRLTLGYNSMRDLVDKMPKKENKLEENMYFKAISNDDSKKHNAPRFTAL